MKTDGQASEIAKYAESLIVILITMKMRIGAIIAILIQVIAVIAPNYLYTKGGREMNKQRRKDLEKAIGLMNEAQEIIQCAADEEQEYADTMPENMQTSEKYDSAVEAAQYLEGAACELEDQAGIIEDSMSC